MLSRLLIIIPVLISLTACRGPVEERQAASFKKAMISFRFDDANTSQLSTIELINRSGMSATVFAIAGYCGKGNYTDMDTLRNLQKTGNEVGSHSLTHARLSFAGKKKHMEETLRSAELLRRGGIACSTFAYPYGMRSLFFDSHVRNNYRQAAVYPVLLPGDFNDRDSDPFGLTCFEASGPEKARTLIEKAILNRLWLILTFHWIDGAKGPYHLSPHNAEEIVRTVARYRERGLIKAVTISAGAEKLAGQRYGN